MVTICMAKQKYSTAAGFHIQLLPFTPSPKARPQQKSRQVRQHHPTGHQLDRPELFQLYFFHLTLWHRKLLPSLPPLLLSPPSYSFNFLEANRKGSQHGRCSQGGRAGDAPRTVPAASLARRSARRQCTTRATARHLAPSLESPRKLWASRLPGQVILLLRDTQGHMRKHFPSEGPSPVEALSTCKLCCGSKDVHPQAFAPFHAWPWPPAMGRCLCERVALITRCCASEKRAEMRKELHSPLLTHVRVISPRQPIYRLQNWIFPHTGSVLPSKKREAQFEAQFSQERQTVLRLGSLSSRM